MLTKSASNFSSYCTSSSFISFTGHTNTQNTKQTEAHGTHNHDQWRVTYTKQTEAHTKQTQADTVMMKQKKGGNKPMSSCFSFQFFLEWRFLPRVMRDSWMLFGLPFCPPSPPPILEGGPTGQSNPLGRSLKYKNETSKK